jgi:Tfp pilus assembly protein PilV
MGNNSQQGSVLIEAVVATSVFLVVILGLASTSSFVVRNSLENVTKIQAAFIAEEGAEAVRLLRDESWASNIAPRTSGAIFYVEFNGAAWRVSTTSSAIDGIFQRSLVVEDVYRDASQNIVASGGSIDPNIKKVTSTVTWNSHGATTTRALSTYLANIFNN